MSFFARVTHKRLVESLADKKSPSSPRMRERESDIFLRLHLLAKCLYASVCEEIESCLSVEGVPGALITMNKMQKATDFREDR